MPPGLWNTLSKDLTKSSRSADYLQYEGTKFSKSKNVGVFGQNARETGVPPSVWRYYLLQNRPETSDSEFTWDDFVAKANAELLNNLGNFVNRMIKFVNAKYDSVLPDPKKGDFDYSSQPYAFSEQDQPFVDEINALLAAYNDQMEHQKIRAGLATVLHISGRGNQFIQENRVDNALLASNPDRCAEIVLLTINLIYVLASVAHPFMPSTSDSIISQLNAIPRSIPDRFSVDVLPGHKIGQAQHLFSRIDPKMVPVWRAQFGGAAAEKAVEGTGEPKLSRKAQEKARKAAQKAVEEAKAKLPKTDEQLVLEEQIKVQGEKVRRVKTGKAEEGDGSIEDEVAHLKALKEEMKLLEDQLLGTTL